METSGRKGHGVSGMQKARVHKRTIVDYMVRYDSGASHHCKSYDEAAQFAREVRGGTYGNPVAITMHKRHITSTYEDIHVFKGEQ